MDLTKFFLYSKTFLFGAAVALAPSFLSYVAGVDWTSYGLSPAAGAVIGAAIMALRTVTSTAVRMTK